MGDKTKIDWCDASWNPVVGCRHDCSYCYARRIAERFGNHIPTLSSRGLCVLEKPMEIDGRKCPYPFDFAPTLHLYKMDQPQRWTRPRTIFVCSMADLFGEWVPDEWIKSVFDSCEAAPQHRYLFLTKNPNRYIALSEKGIMPTGDNFWYGTTITSREDQFWYPLAPSRKTFLSIEPILKPLGDLSELRRVTDWIIVGAETGSRKDKVIPKKEWILELKIACRNCRIPIFMKESLTEIMGDEFVQEYPWTE